MGMLANNPRPTLDTGKVGGAKQSFKDECDINNIVKKYVKTGMVTHVSQNRGRFADVSEVGSYQDAIAMVRDTHKFFLGLTPEVRAEFDHDPAVFLDFISDPANADAIERLGLEEVVEPVKEAVADAITPEVVSPVKEVEGA